MSSLSNNWKVREEITKNFVHQFVLYASWLGKDSGNITFRLDPKPVKEITTIRPERHFHAEEKMESSYVGRCKMDGGCVRADWNRSVVYPCGEESVLQALRGKVCFEREWACYWITDASPGGKNRSKVETKSGRLVVFIWFQLRMMEDQESECETRTSKRQITRWCHRPPQLLSLSHPLTPSEISARRRKRTVDVREHAMWKQVVGRGCVRADWNHGVVHPCGKEGISITKPERGTNDQRGRDSKGGERIDEHNEARTILPALLNNRHFPHSLSHVALDLFRLDDMYIRYFFFVQAYMSYSI